MSSRYLVQLMIPFCFIFSDKISEQLYTRLVQQFAGHYCQVIDNQEPEKGTTKSGIHVVTVYTILHEYFYTGM